MAAHFRWTPEAPEVIPFHANFSYPEAANHSVKTTPRIQPKGGQVYYPGNTIKVEYPAQGYVNFANTVLEMDVTLLVPGNALVSTGTSAVTRGIVVRFQNNIQSIFQKVSVKYGGQPFEEIEDYNVLIRCLTEWTSGNPSLCVDQGTITDGIGNTTIDIDHSGLHQYLPTRVKHIQGYSAFYQATPAAMSAPIGCGHTGIEGNIIPGYSIPAGTTDGVAWTTVTRRYTIQLMTGLTTQSKLGPVKYMASQLCFEIVLASPQSCIIAQFPTGVTTTLYDSYMVALSGSNAYAVGNISLIPEVLEFDASYDAEFLAGLQGPGIPLKLSCWRTYTSTSGRSSIVNAVIHDNSRSVKSIFGVQRRAQASLLVDSGACFFDTSVDGLSSLRGYQYQIGTKYHPACPVECAFPNGSVSNGGAEAYIELQKALNIVGVCFCLIIGLPIINCM
ncbi:MAG: hypothetical protein V4708_17470 [Bacteroidota bacterium]